jgi:hypothetical protein
LRKSPAYTADDLPTAIATSGRKRYPWKNVPQWSPLYKKLYPPKNSTDSTEIGNLQSPDQTGPIASTGEAHLLIAESSEPTLALMTVSASSLSNVGEDGLLIVDISKLAMLKVLDKRLSSSGVEYECELKPLWLTAHLAERAQMGRVHIRNFERELVRNWRLDILRVSKRKLPEIFSSGLQNRRSRRI